MKRSGGAPAPQDARALETVRIVTLLMRMIAAQLYRVVQRFPRAERGATAIEFGLLALPFLATILALFEIAYVDFASESLQWAVTKAARQVLTGQVQAQNVTTASAFVNQFICPSLAKTSPSINCAKLVVDMRTATSFTATDMTNSFYTNATQKFCPGQPGQIVVLRVVYPLPAIMPLSLFNRFVGLANNVPGQPGYSHILMGSALFQEEPYTTSYTSLSTC